MRGAPNEDQSTSAGMTESPTITVEFLRKRLLAERSVSRSARQRADELAKRVMELEEQLKFVSLQKMKAEKATADVLSILESNGISDISEALDSSSDQDVVPSESKLCKASKKEDETSVNSETKRNDLEGYSGSEHDSSSLSGRSLSWRSSKDPLHSHGKKNTNLSTRRRNGFSSADSYSSKQRQGRSCRQIKRREMRSAFEEPNDESVMSNHKTTGNVSNSNCHEDFIHSTNMGKTLEESSENEGRTIVQEGLDSGSSEDDRKEHSVEVNHRGNGRDKDMERALEQQAQLIGRYKAEEKAQREWEEKFRENNNSTPDSFEPGNNSDVTEERDDCNVQASNTIGSGASIKREMKSKVESAHATSKLPKGAHVTRKLSKSETNGLQSHKCNDSRCLQDQSQKRGYDSPASEFAFPTGKTQNKEHSESAATPSLSNSSARNPPSRFHENQLTNTSCSSLSNGDKLPRAEASSSQERALVSKVTVDGIGGVLQALQQARSSLKQKLNEMPLTEGTSAGNAIQPFPAARVPAKAEVPVGCAQLFRVPNDFQFETKSRYSDPSSQLGYTDYHPYMRNALAAPDQYPAVPYMETRSGVPFDGLVSSSRHMDGWSRFPNQKPSFDAYSDRSSDQFVPGASMEPKLGIYPGDRFLSSPYVERRSGFSSPQPSYGPYSNAGLPHPADRLTYPTFPERMQQMPPTAGSSRPFSGSSPAQHFQQNMYR